MRVSTLVDKAAAAAGSRAALARALGVHAASVTQWASGKAHCPNTKIVRMAQIAGLPPKATLAEVIWESLGESVKTVLIGAVAIGCIFSTRDAVAHAAELKPSKHYV